MAIEKGNDKAMKHIETIDPYGYIRELLKMEKEIKVLKEQNNELMYRPGGPGYIETKTRFESMKKYL